MSELIRNATNELRQGRTPQQTTVRALLADFGGQRRRDAIVGRIRTALEEEGLVTEPNFETAWIDAEITFLRRPAADERPADPPMDQQLNPQARLGQIEQEFREARQLIRMLDAANRGVTSVTPQATLAEAVTQMMVNDYSQLPVMTGERSLRGAISWKSIGRRLVQRNNLQTVADAMEPAIVVRDTDPLFRVTSQIIENDFVFVVSNDNRITGIVTATDLSEQFRSLSEPFLLIAQIEAHIRNLMNGKFNLETLKGGCDPDDVDRRDRITSVADLTFGEYIRILEQQANWDSLGVVADRRTVIAEMNKVREIRNDVVHFDPNGLEPEHVIVLRQFSQYLTQIEQLVRSQDG